MKKYFIISAILITIFVLVVINLKTPKPSVIRLSDSPTKETDQFNSATNISENQSTASNWVKINYGGLVDGSILTHTGETVANIVNKIPTYDDSFKGLVQQYLEPYSILCNDALLVTNGPDSLPLVNILSYYPIGSEQPAWASLFREGHFQLYYNSNVIRLFIKGSEGQSSFNNARSVVRFAIQDVINLYPTTLKKLEVFFFTNNYADMSIRLNTIPQIYSVPDLKLSNGLTTVDLSSIESFLLENVTIEAAEIDDKNNLFFYGKKSNKQTLAGTAISISDIAVLYRSIFHYGYNAPYISLDKNEDNRYAKVNFGGHLENTRVGNVVLEADKLFKTLSTGIDPNTHEIIKSRYSRNIPGFLTEDERSLLEDNIKGHSQIRYWFYPDSIGTITDGSIGVVSNNQFFADVERMDVKRSADRSTMETIRHLNHNFIEYESAERTYKELSTIGRIMALVNWMKGLNIQQKIDLDMFLSVRIPAYKTPQKTKKMLAVTAIAFPKELPPTVYNVQEKSQVYYLSDLLEKYDSNTSDDEFLKIASESMADISEKTSPRIKILKSRISEYGPIIKSNEANINALSKEVDRLKYSLDNTNEENVNTYNKLIKRYNSLINTQKSTIAIYNSSIEELNKADINTRTVSSIGGGIDLSPKEFKIISRDPLSPRIVELKKIKNRLKVSGDILASGVWIRSNVNAALPHENMMPKLEWKVSKASLSKGNHSFYTNSGDKFSTTIDGDGKEWESNILLNGSRDFVKYSKESNLIQIEHSLVNQRCVGKILDGGKLIEFSK